MCSITIAVLVHKNVDLFPLAAKSLAQQTRLPDKIEILVTDTLPETRIAADAICASYGLPMSKASTVKLSCAESKNWAFSLAQTDAVATWDADDGWEPTFVEKCVGHMEATGADVVGCNYWQQPPSGPLWRVDLPSFANISQGNPLPSCSVMRVAAHKAADGYRNILYDDWAMWLTLTRMGFKLERVPEYLFTYVRHGAALTQPSNHELAMQQLRELELL